MCLQPHLWILTPTYEPPQKKDQPHMVNPSVLSYYNPLLFIFNSNVFYLGIIIECNPAFFSAKSALFITAKWHLHATASTIIINKYLSGINSTGPIMSTTDILCPDCGDKTTVC